MRGQKMVRRLVDLLLHKPAGELTRLFVRFDADCARAGWREASVNLRSSLIDNARVTGVENIPISGPAMIVSNHPGAYDVVVMSAVLPRNDVKFISSNVPFIRCLPNANEHFIMIAHTMGPRIAAVRSAQRHLASGGLLLFFPRGEVEPDPAFAPDPERELPSWSESVEMFLRLVPETRVIAAAAGGMLSRRWYNYPLVRLWKRPARRQKVAELFQVASQLFGRKTSGIQPTVSFSAPLDLQIKAVPKGALQQAVIGAVGEQIRKLEFSDRVSSLTFDSSRRLLP
jgi:hypothetical protein